jgi:hypothetical protein
MKFHAKLLVVAPVLAAVVFLGACSAPGRFVASISSMALPVVNGPVANEPFSAATKNHEFFATDIALGSRGYVENEFVLEGKANVYNAPLVVYTPTLLPKRLADVVTRMCPTRPA